MATLKDVAELAGVTVTTISRMMNRRCNVSDKTRIKIEAAMKQLDYHPNEVARSLAKRTSNFIGLIVPSAKNYFFSSIIEHIESNVSARGGKLLLCVSNLDIGKEREYYNMLQGNKVQGIILANLTQNIDDFSHITAPLVVIERTPAPRIPCALTDNYNGGCLAAKHLLDKGCRSLLYMSGNITLHTDPNRRFFGFRDTCVETGIVPPLQIEATWNEFITMDYTQTIEKMFQQFPQVDGILASNDVMAAGIVRYCLHHGIRVPEQLKVIGYDDTSFASNCIVPLTTIHQPIEELCRFAVDSIYHAAAGEIVPTSTVFPVQLIQRETT